MCEEMLLNTGFHSYPCPIFSILVYFLLGSPTDTMLLSRSRISSSLIFFFFCFSAVLSIAVLVLRQRGKVMNSD